MKLFLFFMSIAAFFSVSAQPHPIAIGSRIELFLDSTLIDTLKNVSLRLHHPIRREVVMDYNKPWEGNACSFRTVFKDDSIYRMYYTSWHAGVKEDPLSHPIMIAYAESTDGVHWTRPNLGLVNFKGFTNNNIILSDLNGGEMLDFGVMKDLNPNANPEAKYKAVGRGHNPRGIYTFQSNDGIHWRTTKDTPVFTDPYNNISNIGDSQSTLFWDAEHQIYRMYFRAMRNNGSRDIMVSESKDFIHWSEPMWISYGDAPDEQLYTNAIKPYDRAPHFYIGFPVRYVDRGRTYSTWQLPEPELRKQRMERRERYGTSVTDALLMTSRDGKDFYRFPEAFIRPGLRATHNWSYGDNYVGWHVVETKSTFDDAPNELSIYATEGYFTGDACRLRRYSLRIDGFVSAYASLDGGELITKPLLFDGDVLAINYDTSAGGSVLVELQDIDGKPIAHFTAQDCDVIYGDQINRTVSWNGHTGVSEFSGKPVRIRFLLADANLYSFQFKTC